MNWSRLLSWKRLPPSTPESAEALDVAGQLLGPVLRPTRLELRRFAGVGLVLALPVCLSAALAMNGCVPGPELYFPAEGAGAPTLASVESLDGRVKLDAANSLSQTGSGGGARLLIKGAGLDAPSTSVRFGQVQAEIESVTESEDVFQLVVIVPAGPLEGGPVPLQIVNENGFSEQWTFHYTLSDDSLFAKEVGSLVVLGETAYGEAALPPSQGAARFWPEVRPRAVTGLLEDGSLYYLPNDLSPTAGEGEPFLWPTGALMPRLTSREDVASVNQILLSPQDGKSVDPFVFSWESIHRQYDFCAATSADMPPWQPGVSYRLELNGGALTAPIRTDLQAPPGFLEPGEVFFTLQPDSTGVATINRNLDLRVDLSPSILPIGAESFVLAEIVVRVPSLGVSNQPYVLQRVSMEVNPDGQQLLWPAETLAELSEVSTTCLRIGQALALARMGGEGDEATLEGQFLAAGCSNVTDPLAAYRVEAELRISRHAIYAIPTVSGIAGCTTPGSCSADGNLLVDLVTMLRVPVNIADLPVSECVDFVDNDGDGLSDDLDPGCSGNDDTSEQDSALVCDDGLDNDGDGRVDYRTSSQGDPGCLSPSDEDERGVGACDDGKDNDGDGTFDYVEEAGVGDPGCVSVNDIGENENSLICDDGKDNDNDNRTDFKISPGVGDPGCASPTDPTDFDETGTWVCDDRIDNDGDGSRDTEDAGCKPGGTSQHSPYEVDEFNPLIECDDGVDNDRDDTIDYRVSPTANGDTDCKNNSDSSELR